MPQLDSAGVLAAVNAKPEADVRRIVNNIIQELYGEVDPDTGVVYVDTDSDPDPAVLDQVVKIVRAEFWPESE